MATKHPKRILAISSKGGHWVEMRRLRQAWDDCDVVWCATSPAYRDDLINDADPDEPHPRFYFVMEANRWQKMRLIGQLIGVLWVLIRVRPDVVVSTGASPGFFAIMLGKTLFRARTIWVQSIADTESMSMSGSLAGRYADLWLTQWEHLAQPDGPHYHGTII